MLLKARAKINWSLQVQGRRSDGYHNLDMVMQRISLCDTLRIRPARKLRLKIRGAPGLTGGEENLVMKAARLLQSQSGSRPGARMHLKKRIPQGAGLGGGSADAAAALLGLNRLWKLGLSLERLRELALKLGADVPYCLCGRPARVRGIGERIEAFPLKRSYWLLVLQTFPGGLGTRQVFEAYSSQTRHRRYDQSTSPRVIHALQSGNLKALSRAAVNDLRPCAEALRPEILSAVKEVKEAGAAFVQMSGSGSAVFGVFPSFLRAVRTRRRLSAKFPLIYLARTLRSREAP